MIAFTAIWLLIGLIAIAVLLDLSITKKIKWKSFFLSLICYLVLSFIFLVVAGSKQNASVNSTSNHSSDSTAKVFKLVYNDDELYSDGIRFDSDKDGKYTVKIKGLHNGKIKIKNNNTDGENKKFKTQTFNIKKGQTLKVPITLQGDDLVHDFKVVDNHDHSKKFSIYNNSDAANSLASSMEASESADTKDDSSDSSTTKYPHYKSNKKVAEVINKDFSETGSDQLENTKVTYKDPIFYVSVPNDIAAGTSSQQKEFYEKIARTIHSYQKDPTGVIYFENQQGSILAKTKAINNSEVKLK